MSNQNVASQPFVPSLKNPLPRSLALALFLLAITFIPSSAQAGVTKDCPQEPKQNVPISSGTTYYGPHCTISTTGDIDSFQFSASAGDTWSMDSALVLGAASDMCMWLYDPNATQVFMGCTSLAFGIPEVATNQTLKLTGAYTIILKEIANTVVSFGISLERLSPTPPDAVPIALATNVTGNISTPTALAPYSFFATTTGTYQVAASLGTGATIDMCFNVYQPNGASALSSVPCTSMAFGIVSISANFTPTVNGTYLAVLFIVDDDGTDPYNLEVTCFLGKCGSPPPKCQIADLATYSGGTLTMNFTLGTPVAVTWNAWLVSQNTTTLLWSISQPVTEPPVTITKTQAVSKSGKVGVLSTLNTTPAGINCSVFTVVNTGAP